MFQKILINKVKIDSIHKFVASLGHDTDKFKAKEEDYKLLDPCCKYKDPSIVVNHN